MTLILHPVPVPVTVPAPGGDPVVDAVRRRLEDIGTPRTVAVLDATAVGETVPADRRVVAVLARSRDVVAERLTPEGISRVVRIAGVPVLDAGARRLDDGSWAFPPQQPDREAEALAADLRVPVVLALRSTTPFAIASSGASGRWAALLAATDAPALLVDGVDEEAPTYADGPGAEPDPTVGRAEAIRAAFGVLPGSPEAIDVGIPIDGEEDVEARVDRAARLAVRPLPQVPAWHPIARLLRLHVDPSRVVATTLQIGVRLEAPDDLTLGIVTGRLLTALVAEGLAGVPLEHGTVPTGRTTLVGILTED